MANQPFTLPGLDFSSLSTPGLANNAPVNSRATLQFFQSKGVPASEAVAYMQTGKRTAKINAALSGTNNLRTSASNPQLGITTYGNSAALPQGGYSRLPSGSDTLNGAGNRGSGSGGMSDQAKMDAIRRAQDAARKATNIVGTAAENTRDNIRQQAPASQLGRAKQNTAKSYDVHDMGMDSALGGGGFPEAGGMDSVSAMQVSPRDFSDQANSMAANAYSPLYAAIANARTGAQGQYQTSDTVVKGLYDKLVNDIQSSGTQMAAGYDQSGIDAAARAKALQDQQAKIYGQTADSQAELMKSLGQEASASDVLTPASNELAFQQSEAGAQGLAQQNMYAGQKQANNAYTGAIANANSTQGVVAREGLVNELTQALAGLTQQELGARSDQALTAINIGQDLSDRDLSAQTTNAGNSLQASGMNQSAAQQQYANQVAQWQAAQDSARDNRDYNYKIEQDNRNYDLDKSKFQMDAAATLADAQAKAQEQANQGMDFDQLPIPTQIVAQAEQLDPGRGNNYMDFLNGFMNGKNPDDFNAQTFAQSAANAATSQGLSAGVAFATAIQYWKKIMNRG